MPAPESEGFGGGSRFQRRGRVEWVNGSVQDLESLGFDGWKGKAYCSGRGFHGDGN